MGTLENELDELLLDPDDLQNYDENEVELAF